MKKHGYAKKIKKAVSSPLFHAVTRNAAAVLLGFLFSCVSAPGNTAPAGLSLVGGINARYVPAAAAGVIAGAILRAESLDALVAVSSVLLVTVIRLGIGKLFSEPVKRYVPGISVFISSFICYLVVAAITGLKAAETVYRFCTALASGCAAVFFSSASDVLLSPVRGKCRTYPECASLFLFFSVLFLSLDCAAGGLFSPGHAAAALCVMLITASGRITTVLTAGICFGLALGSEENGGFMTVALPLAAVSSSVCSRFGKAGVAGAFAVSEMFALVLKGEESTVVVSAAEAAAALIIFLLIPKKAAVRISGLFSVFSCDSADPGAEKLIGFRLKTAARAVADLGRSVKEVAAALEKRDLPADDDVPERVKSEICEGCPKNAFCWERAGRITRAAFVQAQRRLSENGRLITEDLPQRLQIICISCNALCGAFNRCFCEHNARLTARSELFETKQLAAMQFVSAGAVLEDIAENALSGVKSEPETAYAASSVFEEYGLSADPVIAYSGKNGKKTISAFCKNVPGNADYRMISGRLFERTGQIYMPPVADEYAGSGTMLNFCESPRYGVRVGTAVRKDCSENRCGDSMEYFFDGNGSFFLVLSDGMGRGERAALDSVMTSSLTSRLMRAGFSLDCAVRSVNSALMVKSPDETLATLDILKIDLEAGTAGFYKAGAAYSVIRQGEKTAVVEKSSLPLGILKEVDLQYSEIKLSAGDRVVMMTDGASVLSPVFFRDALRKLVKENAKISAEYIADAAMNMSVSGKNDDITVAVVEIVPSD